MGVTTRSGGRDKRGGSESFQSPFKDPLVTHFKSTRTSTRRSYKKALVLCIPLILLIKGSPLFLGGGGIRYSNAAVTRGSRISELQINYNEWSALEDLNSYNSRQTDSRLSSEESGDSKLVINETEGGGKLFPPDLFTLEQRRKGAVIFYILGVMYMFVALAIVCDEFFVPSLDVIIEVFDIQVGTPFYPFLVDR